MVKCPICQREDIPSRFLFLGIVVPPLITSNYKAEWTKNERRQAQNNYGFTVETPKTSRFKHQACGQTFDVSYGQTKRIKAVVI